MVSSHQKFDNDNILFQFHFWPWYVVDKNGPNVKQDSNEGTWGPS